ncbi:hypothetical protein BV25DRAFT_1815368, partial [Artomyces pyxidatus]
MSLPDAATVKLYQVPRLADDKSNWITYKERTVNALTSKGLKHQLEGTIHVVPTEPTLPTGTPTDAEWETYDKALARYDEYEQNNSMIKQQLYQTVSDSLMLHIKSHSQAKDAWKALCNEF